MVFFSLGRGVVSFPTLGAVKSSWRRHLVRKKVSTTTFYTPALQHFILQRFGSQNQFRGSKSAYQYTFRIFMTRFSLAQRLEAGGRQQIEHFPICWNFPLKYGQ